MVRVTVKQPMRVCPNGQSLELAAGYVAEGPLAAWLIDSGCEVTVEQDDRPATFATGGIVPGPTDKGAKPGKP